jgi:uncharacterized protein YbaA (DUF1428 family)
MAYVDGFVIPVPAGKKDAYRQMATDISTLFLEHGAERIVECWGDDVPRGKLTDFYRAVDAKDDEGVVFAWILWPSRQVRDEGLAKSREDSRMGPKPDMPMGLDRMIFGGFEILLDTGETA